MRFTSLFKFIFIVAFACGKNPQSENKKPVAAARKWELQVDYLPPREAEAPLARVLKIKGEHRSQMYVDRQVESDNTNWQQVGLTDQDGKFVDHDIGERVRYRIAGVFVTPWYDSMRTTYIVADMSLPAKITGFNCVVGKRTTVYVYDKNLEISCTHVSILGNIYSFNSPARIRGARGANAGHVSVNADTIDVQGQIWLVGQQGAIGKQASVGFGRRGGRGGAGGNGGELRFTYKELTEVYDAIKLDGGHGGEPGHDDFLSQKEGQAGERGEIFRVKRANR